MKVMFTMTEPENPENKPDTPDMNDVEFITLPNTIKEKVGSGGIDKKIIDKAQSILREYADDYPSIAASDLLKLDRGIKMLLNKDANKNDGFKQVQLAAIDLKSNGAMFNYPTVSRMAHSLLIYTEVIKDKIETIDEAAVAIIVGHYNSIKAVVDKRQSGDVDKAAEALIAELTGAVTRYYRMQKINPS